MTESEETPDHENVEQGLFKKYPRLSIILIAVLAYGLLLGMCAVVGVLILRG